ncbi:DegT/DnrJ/EryC1/StrS aminotransferase family protein [Candidatus Woesearchaeota archaeon]|nr:DegT/DnrJ/EryC1/StrS aminotransferase family protein [Candidatus Woesearchaeota archaeon]
MSALEKIQELTQKKFVTLTQSGDHAIKHVLELAEKLQKTRLLIQDQGGWLTYKSYARKKGMVVIEVKTDYGIINEEDLIKKITANTVLLVNSMPGYIAEQPMENIQKLCQEKNVLLVNDISGSIGTINGKIGNILLCSCGTYKPINLGYGGFIATNDEELHKLITNTNFDQSKLNALEREIDRLPKRREFFNKINNKIKIELAEKEIIHKNSLGFNVIVKFNNEKQKKEIIDYCNKNNYSYTLCPRYIRVLDNAVSIEVKRVNINYDE